MNQEERLDYLVETLCAEQKSFRGVKPAKIERRKMLRSLMNVRMPGPVSGDFLKIQDEFLKEEARNKGIVSADELPSVREELGSGRPQADRMSIWRGDITRLSADAIVNAANSQLLGCFVPCHGCIDNAIHSAAGLQLREACYQIMREQGHEEPVGSAKITGGYNLPSHYVIHTVGPVVGRQLTGADCEGLRSCYKSCLELAEEKGLESVAFCCISTGEFHFPNEEAALIAIETVTAYLDHCPSLKRIVFNVFKAEDEEIYRRYFRTA